MSRIQQGFLAALRARGMVHSVTHEHMERGLAQVARPVGVYAGFDPTADGLHLGSMVQLMALRWLQRAGFRPVVLVGGATGLIGDPSGRSTERNMLSEDEVAHNCDAISRDAASLLRFGDGDSDAVSVNNMDWFTAMSAVSFLRDVGRHFRVNAMLARDSVKGRMGNEEGISFTEFSYQLLQGYDFTHLARTHGCRVQLGGSDQWGNITSGCELGRRTLGQELYGVTTPLLTTAAGEKFGKSAGNAVWLSPHKTSHFDLFQYLYRAEDADVESLLLMLTEVEAEEVAGVMGEHSAAPEARQGQRRLAEEVTRLVRGEEGLRSAERLTAMMFGAGAGADAGALALTAGDLAALSEHVPTWSAPPSAVVGATVADLCTQAGFIKSKAEVRRLVKNGGLYVNGRREEDARRAVEAADLVDGAGLVVRTGKKKFHVVKVEGAK